MNKKILKAIALVCCITLLCCLGAWGLLFRRGIDRVSILVPLPNGLDFEFEKRFTGKLAIDHYRRIRIVPGGAWHNLPCGTGARTSLRLTWRDEASELILDDDGGAKWLFDGSDDSLWLINQDTNGVVFRTPADSKDCTPFDAINSFYGSDAVEVASTDGRYNIHGRYMGEIRGKYPLTFVEP